MKKLITSISIFAVLVLFVASFFILNSCDSSLEKTDAPDTSDFETTDDTLENEAEGGEKFKINGIMINRDEDFLAGRGDLTKEEIAEFAYQFEGTHVTDYIMCIGAHLSLYPSDVWMSYQDKYIQKEENGVPVDYSNNTYLKAYYDQFINTGVDYFEVLSKAFPEVGINFWLSIRMNDHHDITLKTSPLISDYHHENPNLRINRYPTLINPGISQAYDYTHEEVRNHYLELINEALGRYDVYGFELEFLREAWLWYYGGEYNGLDILTDFIRDVDEVISVYEKKYGHDIKLAVEVPSDIETCYYLGMDVVTWASEGLIDLVVPKAHHSIDNTMPVRTWSSLLKPYGVEIAPDMEEYIRPYPTAKGYARPTLETFAGTAALYYSQGADKVHLYNLGPAVDFRFKEWEKTDNYSINSVFDRNGSFDGRGKWLTYTTIGSYEKLLTLNRKVLLTYNDMLSRLSIPNTQLPIACKPGDTATLVMGVGEIPHGAKVTFSFSNINADDENPPSLMINSQPCRFIGTKQDSERRTANTLCCYDIPAPGMGDVYFVAEITAPSNRPLFVDYVEVYIEPAE